MQGILKEVKEMRAENGECKKETKEEDNSTKQEISDLQTRVETLEQGENLAEKWNRISRNKNVIIKVYKWKQETKRK